MSAERMLLRYADNQRGRETVEEKIEITPYLSQKIRVISLLAILMVFIQHGSYGLPDYGYAGVFKHLVSLGVCDYPVSYFFVVSGFFLARKYDATIGWYVSELKKRIKSLLVPYLIYTLFGYLVLAHASEVPVLDGLGITSLLPVVGPLWYVRTLIALCIVSPIIITAMRRAAHSKTMRYLFLAVFIAGCLISFPARKSFGMATLYFSFGTFLAMHGSVLRTYSARAKCVTGLCALVALLVCKFIYVLTTPIINTSEVFLRWLVVPCTIVTVWYGYDLIFKGNVVKLTKRIEFASQTTFFMYCMESFIRPALFAMLAYIPSSHTIANTPVGIISTSIIIAMVGLVMAFTLRTHTPKVYGLLSGGR